MSQSSSYDAHRESLLAHYIALASDPGWKRYAWERVKQLAIECPELYADFPERVTEHFRAIPNPPLAPPIPEPEPSGALGSKGQGSKSLQEPMRAADAG